MQKMQTENQKSRARLARTRNNIVTKTNHMRDKSVNGEENDLVDKFKDQISITYSQSNQDKQEMPNITSGLQETPKNNLCDFSSIPDTGSSIMNIPNTNNIVNNKYFSQQRIHSHTTTTENRDPDPSQSTNHPLTNFPNGEEFNPPSIFSDGESFCSKNHKHSKHQ